MLKEYYYRCESEIIVCRFKVHHVLSQAQESWSGKRGIVSVDLLKDFVGASDKQACVFTCGPKGFLTTAKQ